MEEKTRGDQDRMARVEAQLSGLHESVLNTTNEMILLKGDNLESQGASAAQMESSELCEVPICRAGSPKRAEQDDGVGSRSTHAGIFFVESTSCDIIAGHVESDTSHIHARSTWNISWSNLAFWFWHVHSGFPPRSASRHRFVTWDDTADGTTWETCTRTVRGAAFHDPVAISSHDAIWSYPCGVATMRL